MSKLSQRAALFVAISLSAAGLAYAQNDSGPTTTAQSPESAVPAPTIDSNADGKADAWDRDGNGKADAWDINGDGKPDIMDDDGDGKPDAKPMKPKETKPDR